MNNHDDFWTSLAAGHSNTTLASAMDSHLSGKSIGESFGGVSRLTDKHRQANALSLPVEAGTKVVFAGGLGAHLTYDDVPADGVMGEVVKVKSATGEITHHDGKVFVKWADGKFRPIHAEHLRLAGQGKSGRRAGGLDTILKEMDLPEMRLDTSSFANVRWLLRNMGVKNKDHPKYGDAKKALKALHKSLGKRASVIRVASLGDLTQFLKRADGKLVHKSTNDLWSYAKDADGNFLVERLFDDEGEPLQG